MMLSRDVKHITSVDTIYQECDYITVHVPLLDSTRQMINKDSLGQMKDGVVILNFARDLLVNDDDMAEVDSRMESTIWSNMSKPSMRYSTTGSFWP